MCLNLFFFFFFLYLFDLVYLKYLFNAFFDFFQKPLQQPTQDFLLTSRDSNRELFNPFSAHTQVNSSRIVIVTGFFHDNFHQTLMFFLISYLCLSLSRYPLSLTHTHTHTHTVSILSFFLSLYFISPFFPFFFSVFVSLLLCLFSFHIKFFPFSFLFFLFKN